MKAKRVQISIQPQTLEKLDRMAEKSNMTRSAVVALLVNQAQLTDEMTVSQIIDTIENDEKLQQVLAELFNRAK